MSWIDELDRHGYNVLLDELVWHLENGHDVVSIRRENNGPDGPGFRFILRGAEPHFLSVTFVNLDAHWNEARQITSRFWQLDELNYEADQ